MSKKIKSLLKKKKDLEQERSRNKLAFIEKDEEYKEQLSELNNSLLELRDDFDRSLFQLGKDFFELFGEERASYQLITTPLLDFLYSDGRFMQKKYVAMVDNDKFLEKRLLGYEESVDIEGEIISSIKLKEKYRDYDFSEDEIESICYYLYNFNRGFVWVLNIVPLKQESYLDDFEKDFDCLIPEELRDFIIRYNASTPVSSCFKTLKGIQHSINSFISLNKEDERNAWEHNREMIEERDDDSLIAFATTMCRDYLCFDKESLKIVLLSHDSLSEECVAAGFEDFINSIYNSWEILESDFCS